MRMSLQVGPILGRRLRSRRRLLGLTQTEVGRACGISFQQIEKYENAGSQISAAMLWRLSQVLEVPVGYFFDGLDREAELSEFPRSFAPTPPRV